MGLLVDLLKGVAGVVAPVVKHGVEVGVKAGLEIGKATGHVVKETVKGAATGALEATKFIVTLLDFGWAKNALLATSTADLFGSYDCRVNGPKPATCPAM